VAVPRLSPCPRRRSSCGQARGERESGWVGGSAGRRRHRPGRARAPRAAPRRCSGRGTRRDPPGRRPGPSRPAAQRASPRRRQRCTSETAD